MKDNELMKETNNEWKEERTKQTINGWMNEWKIE